MLPLINKLQQFTAHPALLDPSIPHDVKSLCLHSAKFELLMMELDGIEQSKRKSHHLCHIPEGNRSARCCS